MDTSSTLVYGGGAFVSCYLLIEIVKFLVNKLLPPRSGLSPDEQQMLHDLHTWHEKTGPDGRPLWYIPASLGEQSDKMLDILDRGAHNQEKMVWILDGLVKEVKELGNRSDN